jgi:hypothetical protein
LGPSNTISPATEHLSSTTSVPEGITMTSLSTTLSATNPTVVALGAAPSMRVSAVAGSASTQVHRSTAPPAATVGSGG